MGAPHFFSRSTARPRGPRVTLTARASCFTPRRMASRASWSNAILLAAMASPSIFRVELLADHRENFALAQDEVFFPVDFHVGTGEPAEEDAVALLHFERLHFAVLEHAPGADGNHGAFLGLVLRGVGEKDAAGGLLLRLAPLDDDLIAQGLQGHDSNLHRLGNSVRSRSAKGMPVPRVSVKRKYMTCNALKGALPGPFGRMAGWQSGRCHPGSHPHKSKK